jgi:hypothetical protein
MKPVEIIPGMGGGKGEWWRGWNHLWYILRDFVNVTMYLQYNNSKKYRKIKLFENINILKIISTGYNYFNKRPHANTSYQD